MAWAWSKHREAFDEELAAWQAKLKAEATPAAAGAGAMDEGGAA